MAKHLNVNLTFNADTEQAKKKIQELQASLQNVAKLPGAATELFDDANIQKASQAALELERHLSKAVSVDTGKLDLSRFSQSLKSSGKDLNSYCNTLMSIGPAGQQAFLNLAQAIATADTPVTRVNAKLKELGTTLANTARWQISSSILHGFMGAIQSAYGYAQDLNESLNDIRIVTGKSTTEMARFAKQANDAAKALSTTTNEYAEASLIYFQQGDSMEEVEEKAAITVKLAQVTGQGMETVSDQMTAVWNNFYDGSQSLEHYADAMARLGAITASSSDEIAQGLEKFASVAETIGLGFDEAAAALATVTANTRQSADVVGTAFKTIFARIQGLNLGETLEDGTTLNKYSEALNKVGINIKNTLGQIKDMNTILNEMGAKWDTLSKDQQIALAQTVAGVRQYSQLVSLMENFDDYQSNLVEAQRADGELASQSAIYAESWEAARDRVQAALEGVYDSLINDEFFIDLLNGLEKVIKGVEAFIDTFGGLGGVLQAVSGIFMTMYANKMPEVMSGLTQNIRTLTGQAKKDMESMQIQMGAKLAVVQEDPSLSEGFKIQAEGIEKVNIMKQKLVKVSETLTTAEREEYEARIRNVQTMYQDIDALVKKKEAAEKKVGGAKKQVVGASVTQVQSKFAEFNGLNAQATKREAKVADLNAGSTSATNIAALEQEEAALEKVRTKLNQVDDEITQMAAAYGLTTDQVEALVAADGEITPDIYKEIQSQIDAVTTSFSNLITRRTALDDMTNAIRSQISSWDESSQKINEAAAQLEALGKKGEAQKLLISHADQMKKKMEAYLTAVAKVARDKGLDSVARRADVAKKKIENMKAAMMVKKGKVDLGSMISTKEFDEMMKMAEKSLNNLDSQIDRTRTQMGQMQFDPAAMQELEKSAEEAANANVELTNALENTNQQAEESPQSSFKMSEALTSLGGVAMSTMAAITTLKNGFETIFSPNTSGLEKAMAVVSIFTGVLAAYNAAIAFGTTLKKLDTSAETTNILAKSANALASKVAAALKLAAAPAVAAETGAIWANTAAWYANPIMWIAVIIVAVIAALAALVAIIGVVSNALKSMDSGERLKAAEEEAARMAEELDKARQAADELRNSISKYDSAVDKMKTLTEGTEEYRQALDEANAEARKLIDENEELAGMYHFNAETGLIEFDEGALESIQDKANQKVAAVESGTILANSNVLAAKNNVLTDENTKKSGGEQVAAVVGTAIPAILASMIPVIGPALAGTIVATSVVANAQQKPGQEAALNALAEEFVASGHNFTVALDNLSDKEQAFIESLDMTDTELQALVTELAQNKEAIVENNKQLAHANFSNREEYQNSSNKDFLSETVGADISADTERLYEEKYKDKAGGMKDKDIQRAYAEMMGWDPDEVDNKSGNKAVYKDAEGNEVEIDDEVARKYLAQQEAIKAAGDSLTEHAKKVEDLEKQEQILAKAFENGAISYDEYISEVQRTGKELGFTTEEMDKYTKTYGSSIIKRERKEQNLATTMSTKFEMGDENAKQFVDEITKDMSDEQLEVALDIAATAKSLDDFKRQFQHATTEALITSINNSQDNVKSMLASANENGKFSSADLNSLKTDDNFTAWLEQNNRTMQDLTKASYSKQYNIISQFYSDLQKMESENLELQKENYQEDLAEYQAIMDYKLAQEKNDAETMQSIQEAWGSSIDFEAYMDLNTEDLQTKLDEVANRIQEITDQKYEIDMSWDGIDQLEGAMDEMAGVVNLMEKDARKVGDSYQITAAQGKEWIEMYPELFKNAKVTTEGLIELSEEDYEAFKTTQEGERKAAIETEIQKLQARLEELKAEEKAAQAELALIAAIEEGKKDYSNASAESIAKTRSNLTQFYIDSGYDEASANQLALQQMALSQEEYNQLVADSTNQNAKNMAEGAQSGAEAMRKTYASLTEKLKAIFSNIGLAIKAIFTGDWSSIGTYFSAAWDATKGQIVKESTTTTTAGTTAPSIGDRIEKYQSTAVLDDTREDAFASVRDSIQNNLDQIAASRQNIDNQITYLQALQNQGIGNYGESNVNSIVPEIDKETLDAMADAVERYHSLTKEAEALNHEISMIDARMSQAFGKDKVNLMKQQEAALQDLKHTQEQLLLAQQAYLASDFSALSSSFSQIKVTATTDSFGNLSNYAELVAAAQAAYNDAINTYNTSEQTEDDKAALEEAEKIYDKRIALLEQYEDTLSEVQNAEETLIDTQSKISAAALETITYEIEYKLDIDDRNMAMLDYKLDKIADDFYKKAESAALIIGSMNGSGSLAPGGKLGTLIDNYGIYSQAKSALAQKHASGTLTDSDYAAGLQEITDRTMDNLNALNELDKSMLSYYGDTLAAASEELSLYTERMEHHNTVLSHYQSLLSLIGEETNFEAMGIVLAGQEKIMANNLKVSTETYEMHNAEAEKWAQKMNDSIEGSAEFELFKKNWEAAEAAAREAQDQMLSDVEAWAEAQKAILENSLSSLGQTLEEALTGGLNFDQLTTQMDRAASLQEEYLTSTNKIYETTKMMRTAQQAIDSSSNTVAKEKLKNFITQTKSLQEQGKLSQYELDMQQAKYDLLVAEIALEEAQNAKSTVRLQRDSEGNFGYVYTADAGAVNEAQQKFDDAQNALYNKGLEGANDYTQKYQQTMSEMTDTLKTIQEDYLNGSFASEAEYNTAMEEAKAFYFEKLQVYSQLYGAAISTDSAIAAEAWSTDFAGMVNNTEEWKVKVDDYIAGATSAFKTWSQVVATVKDTTGQDLSELATNVSTITDANDDLADEILNEEDGVLKAMEDELIAVGDLTTAYADYRDSVREAIKALEELATASNNSLSALAGGTTTTTITTTTTPNDIASNDDGGYTGSWGPSGKLAFLHEKEMILTQDETSKFFNHLAMMESILATLDLYALQQSVGNSLINPSYYGDSSSTIEQNVKIEASFPGVTDRNEIEEAFNNLVNKASQYANRK